MPPELLVSAHRATGIAERRAVRAAAAPRESAYRWVDPEWRWLVEAYSLDRFAAIGELANLSETDEATHSASRRCELAVGTTQRHVVHIKIERRPRWRDRWRSLLSGSIFAGQLWLEFELSRRLLRAGFGVPAPLVYNPRGRHGYAGWLVLIEPDGAIPLAEYLVDLTAHHPTDRLQLVIGLGREVARLHDGGFHHGRLNASNVLIVGHGSQTQFAFVDLDRGGHGRQVSLDRRARELAALLAALPASLATRGERGALLDAYAKAATLGCAEPDFRDRVARALQRRPDRRTIWDAREDASTTLSSAARLEAVEAGRLWCDARDRTTMQRAGLTSLDAVLATKSGRLLRTLVDRENWRLELRGFQGPYGAYLKKHRIVDWKTRLRARLRFSQGASAGRVEAENIAQLQREGTPTMRLIAFGERLQEDGTQESFVLTEELTGFIQLDHFLSARFRVRDPARGRVDPDLARLIREVARVARNFHRWGHNHRDFYCCHFFIRESRLGRFEVNLIDLQRVQSGRWLNSWWVLKDLTQLAYSAPWERIGCRERVLFLHHYFGVQKLLPQHKRWVRRVLAKQRWKQWRLGPHV